MGAFSLPDGYEEITRKVWKVMLGANFRLRF